MDAKADIPKHYFQHSTHKAISAVTIPKDKRLKGHLSAETKTAERSAALQRSEKFLPHKPINTPAPTRGAGAFRSLTGAIVLKGKGARASRQHAMHSPSGQHGRSAKLYLSTLYDRCIKTVKLALGRIGFIVRTITILA